MVERFHGMEEVRGSIPLSSTRRRSRSDASCEELPTDLDGPLSGASSGTTAAMIPARAGADRQPSVVRAPRPPVPLRLCHPTVEPSQRDAGGRTHRLEVGRRPVLGAERPPGGHDGDSEGIRWAPASTAGNSRSACCHGLSPRHSMWRPHTAVGQRVPRRASSACARARVRVRELRHPPPVRC